jgi:hypothetical protein
MPVLMAQQPNFAPYLGFFDRASRADVVVIQDDLQYNKQEWQNRNRIVTRGGWRWLTIPVRARHLPAIRDVEPAAAHWPARHIRILRHEYGPAGHLDRVDTLRAVLDGDGPPRNLAAVNVRLVSFFLAVFGLRPRVVLESALGLPAAMEPNERLVTLCRLLDCDTYLSGPGGRGYVRPEYWDASGIRLTYHDFHAVPYPQVYGGWEPDLSVIDLYLSVADPAREFRCRRGASGVLEPARR